MEGRGEFKRTHRTGVEVTKSFDRIEGSGATTLSGEPLVDEEIAEFIGKGIGQKSGEAFEGFA